MRSRVGSSARHRLRARMQWLLWAVPIPNAHVWVQPISFVLVGALALSSVRGFLLSFSQVFSAWSTAVTSNSTVLLLAQVMGAYLVATLLMLRMKVPPEYRCVTEGALPCSAGVHRPLRAVACTPCRRGITDAVGDVRFDFFHRWSDAIFVVSALASVIVFAVRTCARVVPRPTGRHAK